MAADDGFLDKLREWYAAKGEPVPEWTDAGWLGGARERGYVHVTARIMDDENIEAAARSLAWESEPRAPSANLSADAGPYSVESVLHTWTELRAGSGEPPSPKLN